MSSENLIQKPMKNTNYEIHPKIMSLTHRYTIKEKNGSRKYKVQSDPFLLGGTTILKDINGRCLWKIRKSRFSYLNKLKIASVDTNGTEHPIATMQEKFKFITKNFAINSTTYGNYIMKSLNASGDSFALWEEDGTMVAIILTKLSSIAIVHKVEVFGSDNDMNEEYHTFILALIVIFIRS
ncbi:unnamed protein product [Rotaria socialis]|uniref:Uncharacterized protein n=1 Tax=Rotaria socialis TaxID=392032 RepID=A0A817R5K7_9BILA|nr:unnamed protein product [Rotaria socialis]CAF3413526.1 unnamed protein product [Rotaria socialis]CAF3741153.1 unnamed protein product [Rotaria socialis]CAF4251967.1 unnamed protein product [Rotaria socialis]CAF4420077.1 unnamed protein product [Rotaria socialis]